MDRLLPPLCCIVGKYASLVDRQHLRRLWPKEFAGLAGYEIDQMRSVMTYYFECDMKQLDALLVREGGRVSGALLGSALVHDLGVFTMDQVARYAYLRLYIHLQRITEAVCKDMKQIFTKLSYEDVEPKGEYSLSSGDPAHVDDPCPVPQGCRKLIVYIVTPESITPADIPEVAYTPSSMHVSRDTMMQLDERCMKMPSLRKCYGDGVEEFEGEYEEYEGEQDMAKALSRWRAFGFRVPHISHIQEECECSSSTDEILFQRQCSCGAIWCNTCIEVAEMRRSSDARQTVCRSCSPSRMLSGIHMDRLRFPLVNVTMERVIWLAAQMERDRHGFKRFSTLLFTPNALQNGQRLRVTIDPKRTDSASPNTDVNLFHVTDGICSPEKFITVERHDHNTFTFTRFSPQRDEMLWMFTWVGMGSSIVLIDDAGCHVCPER